MTVFLKKKKKKENFTDNPGHTILRLVDILPNSSFTLSETEHGCQ